ncbi:MAG: hypothetical protein ABJN75_16545 [Hoeflea sp.]|uniref:hypothetical protein n=1 Tax=Hoeflea sp. TaxID=1940281 RepID=UPI003296C42B
MIIGLSMFDTVLDRLSRERPDGPRPGSVPWAGIRGLNSRFVGAMSGLDRRRSGDQLGAVYSGYDYDSDGFVPPPKPVIDTSLFKRVSPEDIAKDINLLSSDTAAELKSKRRKFARLNHPDRVPMEWRQAATTRMKIANHLVDEALRRV